MTQRASGLLQGLQGDSVIQRVTHSDTGGLKGPELLYEVLGDLKQLVGDSMR